MWFQLIQTTEMMEAQLVEMDALPIEQLKLNGFEKMGLYPVQVNEEMTEEMALQLALHQTIVMMATTMMKMVDPQHDNLKRTGIALLDHPQKPVCELTIVEMEQSWVHMMGGEMMATMMMRMAATSNEVLSLDGHELSEIMKQQVNAQIHEEMESLSKEISNTVMMVIQIQEMDDQMNEVLRKTGCELEEMKKIQAPEISVNF